jgi:hypothetical protein
METGSVSEVKEKQGPMEVLLEISMWSLPWKSIHSSNAKVKRS